MSSQSILPVLWMAVFLAFVSVPLISLYSLLYKSDKVVKEKEEESSVENKDRSPLRGVLGDKEYDEFLMNARTVFLRDMRDADREQEAKRKSK